MKLIFDTEADNLLPSVTQMWCICTADLDTDERRSFGPDVLEEGIAFLFSAEALICHNEIGYDLEAIKKLYRIGYKGEVVDTLVLSRLLNPDRIGGHSLEALSKSMLGEDLKIENTDWSKYTENMLKRCEVDVEINKRIYLKLLEEMNN